jgi:hypothetical protein
MFDTTCVSNVQNGEFRRQARSGFRFAYAVLIR